MFTGARKRHQAFAATRFFAPHRTLSEFHPATAGSRGPPAREKSFLNLTNPAPDWPVVFALLVAADDPQQVESALPKERHQRVLRPLAPRCQAGRTP